MGAIVVASSIACVTMLQLITAISQREDVHMSLYTVFIVFGWQVPKRRHSNLKVSPGIQWRDLEQQTPLQILAALYSPALSA